MKYCPIRWRLSCATRKISVWRTAVYESACPSQCSHVVQNDFWIIFHNSKFLRWMTRVHQRSEVNSLPFLLCFFDDFFISLNFRCPSSFYTTDLSLLSVERQLNVLQVQRGSRDHEENWRFVHSSAKNMAHKLLTLCQGPAENNSKSQL